MKTVLTIAGSDCSGGAGIQADIKTITVHGLYAMSAVTALTAQNTTGVSAVHPVSPDFLRRQLACVFEDLKPDAVKVGMLVNTALAEVVAACLEQYHARNIVIDPVLVSTSGQALLDPAAQAFLMDRLLPLARLITPNIPEAAALSGCNIETAEDMAKAAAGLLERLGGKTAVLLKGGHGAGTADDLLCMGTNETGLAPGQPVYRWFQGERIHNPNTHGTGCTLSSAVAVHLAQGKPLTESVRSAKDYLTGAIADGLDLGKGRGPLNHMYRIR